jgi:uncharacterized Zn-binding protein involved in type VI secretion
MSYSRCIAVSLHAFRGYGDEYMKDEHGRDMARLGDTTDHGGRVIEAAPDIKHMGIPVALDGHLVECPKCGGNFLIVAVGKRTHHGVRIGYLGDKTGCGATLMRRESPGA